MPRNDEGEFELVLGNRQLLSGFFIVVILFGVFFTMGYIVGRHSFPAPLTTAASQDSTAPQSGSPAADPAPGQAKVITEAPKPEAPPPETAEKSTGTQPATAPAETPHPAEKRPAAPRPTISEASSSDQAPPPGTYFQVAAPKRTAAEGVLDSLKNKGIAAVLAPGPNEETVRILVGPLESSSIGKMKVDLESAGFKPFLKKY